MSKYIYIENNEINGCGETLQIDESTTCIEVSDEIYNAFLSDKLKYIYKSGKIVSNPDYAAQKSKKEAECKIAGLKVQLDELDKKRIRAVCENEIKDETTGETWLDFYNKEIANIRKQITALES